jgi:hypothetical protein
MPKMAEPKAWIDGEEKKGPNTLYIRRVNRRIPKEAAGSEVKEGRPKPARCYRTEERRSPGGDMVQEA